MGYYRIADRVFDLQNRYPYTERLCEAYRVEATGADYTIAVTEADIAAERSSGEETYGDGYLESLAIYRRMAGLLQAEDCFLMHAAVLGYEGKAYAFTARSGVGKSTHIKLWRKLLGDRVIAINGDKPLIRREADGTFTAYGTPWCGKENWQTNTKAQLAGICLLERGTTNTIVRAGEEAIPFLWGQFLQMPDPRYRERLFDALAALLDKVPVWRLSCTPEPEAAEVAFAAMCGSPLPKIFSDT